MDSAYLKKCFDRVCAYQGDALPHSVACVQSALPGFIKNLEGLEESLPNIGMLVELPGNTQIAKGEELTIRVQGNDLDTTRRQFKMKSSMNFDTNLCHIDSMEVNKAFQSSQIGTCLLGIFMSFAGQSGFSKYTVDAAEKTGAYFWAKMGFLPVEDGREDLESNIRDRYEYLKPLLDIFTRQKIEKILDMQEVEKIWDLADEKGAQSILSQLNHFSFNVRSDREYEFATDMRDVLDNVKNISIGKLLLCGLSYSAELNLRDTEQLNRLGDMVGIAPYNFQPAVQMKAYP